MRTGQLWLTQVAVRAKLARHGLAAPPPPLNVTFSVTNRCQSRCRTCGIWRLYRDDPGLAATELTLDEIERVFRSMSRTWLFNVSGGEPFLRPDLPAIVELACRHLRPAVVHIPTNALAVDRVVAGVEQILDAIRRTAPATRLTLKPSFDGVGEVHDAIRGVPGNYERVQELLRRLEPLRRDHPELGVGLGTVVSRWNVRQLDGIAEAVDALAVDSYISEVAENRAEMFNRESAIGPELAEFAEAMEAFGHRTAAMMGRRRGLSRITLAFRRQYYDLAVRILREGRQVLPCHAGLSNVHLSAYGEVWACCVLGDEASFGNLRDHGYDFQAVWRSARADAVRRDIRAGHCHCPLANQAYSNLLFSPQALLRVAADVVGPGDGAEPRP